MNLREELKKDIINIINSSKDELIILMGDNSTGKSQIGEHFKNKILVLDNYKGHLKDIPMYGKTLVITHDLNLVVEANYLTKLIITSKDSIYAVTTCDANNYGDAYDLVFKENVLINLLSNALSKKWSNLNEMFFYNYKNKKDLTKTDQLFIKTISELI